MTDDTRRVWSSDSGRVREESPRPSSRPGDGRVRITRESKGRRGKTVTVIRGLDLEPAALADLAGQLKKRCGVGGSAKAGEITLQGDQEAVVREELVGRGFEVR